MACLTKREDFGVLGAIIVAYVVGMLIVFFTMSDWTARQTWAVILTGLVIIWYTWETMQLRRVAIAQRELQLRPFVVIEPVEHGFRLRNLGPGTALNVRAEDVVISAEDQIRVHFPERISVLPCGEVANITAQSFHGEANAGDFFAAHLDPQWAAFELDIRVTFQDTEMRRFSVAERVRPGTLEIQGVSSTAL